MYTRLDRCQQESAALEIWAWNWNYDEDANVDHLLEHSIRERTVVEIAELDDPRFREDEDEEHASSHHMIGSDLSGQMWVICIVEIDPRTHTWSAITGWPADDGDKDWYWRNR